MDRAGENSNFLPGSGAALLRKERGAQAMYLGAILAYVLLVLAVCGFLVVRKH